MDQFLYLAISLLLVSGLIFGCRRKARIVNQQRINRIIDKVQAALDGDMDQSACFAGTLKQASLTTRIQSPRLRIEHNSGGQPPERYRICASLAEQGLDPARIAAVLSISEAEAAQLSRLCLLRKTAGPRQQNS